MNIPFSPPYIDQLVIQEVMDSLKSNWITSGPKVKLLENEVAALTGTNAAVCVNSWTSGAILMLKWFGVGEGDEVIIPAYSYCATALCVIHCGATPVMVDIRDDFTIDPEQVKTHVTAKTKAVITVDIAGLPCQYEEIRSMLSTTDVRSKFVARGPEQEQFGRIMLLSDAAHSIGAAYNGFPSALQSDVTIFSFHAVKNITTGEGGCICLNLPYPFDHNSVYSFLKLSSLNGQNKDAFSKSQGGNWRYDILMKGYKMNMPDVCAAIGLAQIRQYKGYLLPLRKLIALKYCTAFKEFDWFIPPVLQDEKRESSYHLFPLRINGIVEAERDQIIDRLVALGIVVNVHFIPMPMLSYFKSIGFVIADFPNSYAQYACEISLPIYPQLTDAEVDYIIEGVISCVHQTLLREPSIDLLT